MTVALVGRDEIVAQIRLLIDQARSGRSGAIVISGPPGIGKSAVIEQARREADGCTVLVARGIQSESELAYASLQQLLQPLAELSEGLPPVQRDALEAALGTGGGPAEPMLVGLGVLGVLAEAAEQQTLACLLDDVHWFDSASRRALAFATRRLNAERVAVIAAQRARPGLPQLAHEFGVAEIALPPLTGDQEADLLTQILGSTVASDVATRIHAATAGFPLGVVALTRLLTTDQLSGHEPLPEPLPLGAELHDVFLRELTTLPDMARRFLLVAAADDSGMVGPVMRAADHIGASAEMLGRIEQADLLVLEQRSIEFRHPLIRSVVYQSAGIQERREAHSALAMAYGEMGDQDRQVWHRALGAIPPDQAIAEEVAEVASRSDRRSAYAAASAAFELASTLSARRDHEAEMLVAGAQSAWRAGRLDRAMTLGERARALVNDPALLYELDFIRGGIHLGKGQTDTAYEILVGAGQRVVAADADRAIRIWALASEGVSFAGNRETATRLARVVNSVDTPERSPTQKLYLKMILGLGHLFNDEMGLAATQFRRALDETDSVARIEELAAAARVAMYLGDDARSISLGVRAVERAKAEGTVGFIPMAGGRLALLEVMTGQFTLALATADEIIRLSADTDQPELGVQCLCWSGLVAAYRGLEDASRRFVDQARKASEERPLGSVANALAWVEGALELSLGRMESAARHLARIDHPGIRVMAGLDAIEAAAPLSADQAEFVGRAIDYAASTGEPWALARAAHGRALMSSGPEAEGFFREALSFHAQSSRPFEYARSRLAYGAWLRRHRRRRDARDQLQEAFVVFDSLAASPWIERAQAEIRASGGTSRRRDALTFDMLTPQEVQVARLVADGMTNRQAATHLFLSPRTVDYHLRNIFVKLRVTSRTELARVLVDSGKSVASLSTR